jgi:hypothetical protein
MKMKKLLISCLRIFCTVVFLIVVGTGVGFWYLWYASIPNNIQYEIISPDGRHKAVVFERNHGAMDPFITHVSLLRAGQELSRKSGNVFIATAGFGAAPAALWGGPDVDLEWIDDDTLLIVFDEYARTRRREERVKGIDVKYETEYGDFHVYWIYENETIERIVSPGGNREAVLFGRTHRVTSAVTTEVSIMRRGIPLFNKTGNAFSADTSEGRASAASWGGPKVDVEWIAADTLLVKHSESARVRMAEPEVKGVLIKYESLK